MTTCHGFIRTDSRTGEIVFHPTVPDSSAVKLILGGKWETNAWRLPRLYLNLKRLVEMYPEVVVDRDLKTLLESDHGFPIVSSSVPSDLVESWRRLYLFQREAVDYLTSTPHPGTLLGLSPGLGKTAVSLIAAKCLGLEKVLVVCPLSLIGAWQREARMWVGQELESGWGKTPSTRYVVTNYDTIARRHAEYSKISWDLVIFDESVMLKNRSTQRVKAARSLRTSTALVWELSGSPITHDITDLWSQFNLLMPKHFSSFWRFADQFALLEHSPWGPSHSSLIVGTKPGIDFKDEFKDVMLVVSQDDVLDLPEYLFQVLDLPLTREQQKAYNELSSAFVTTLESGQRIDVPNIMAQLIRLQQVTSNLVNLGGPDLSSKHETIVEMLKDELWEKPVLIWSHWVPGANALYERLRLSGINACVANGSRTTCETADETLEAFKAGKYDVLVLSLGVGKFGHTLTNVRTVVYNEKSWSSDDYVQSLSRVRRIGLEHRPLLVTLRCPGTVDQLVEENLATKSFDISRVGPVQLAQLLKGLGRGI